MTDEIQESELLERATRAGEPVSSHQLKRFRDAGAMPRPRVVHVRGARGSSAFYPAWAVEQLVAVARIHRTVRKLEDLVVAVWWEEHWVDPEKLRAALIEPLVRLADEAREARGGEQDPYEAADRLMAAMKDDGRPSDALALMRQRLNGRADFANVLWTMLVIGLGGKAPWEQEDRSRPTRRRARCSCWPPRRASIGQWVMTRPETAPGSPQISTLSRSWLSSKTPAALT